MDKKKLTPIEIADLKAKVRQAQDSWIARYSMRTQHSSNNKHFPVVQIHEIMFVPVHERFNLFRKES